MIDSFVDEETKSIFLGHVARQLPVTIQGMARRKLLYQDDADDLRDLMSPPGNRFEPLQGDGAGRYCIRLNDQWRICFVWEDGKAKRVEVVDYR